MVVFGSRSNERCCVNVSKFTANRCQSASVAALGWVSASAARAFTRRWQACDSVADRPVAANESIGKRVLVDALRIGKSNRMVAGRAGCVVVTMRIVDGGRL
jgi:hypothetical protein